MTSEKMLKVSLTMGKIGLILLGVVALLSFSDGLLLRSEEHIRNRENMLKHVDKFAANYVIEYTNYTMTGEKSPQLDAMMKMMTLDSSFGKLDLGEFPPELAIMSCVACRSFLALILQRYRSGSHTVEEIKQDAVNQCMSLTTYGIVVCEGVVELNYDIFIHIIDARPSLNANQMCSMVLQGECGDPDQSFNFQINVSPGPPITQSKSGSAPRNPNEIKVLHFSDPHYDPVG